MNAPTNIVVQATKLGPGVKGTIGYAGGTRGPCPNCYAEITTEHSEPTQLPNGLRFVDVRCAGCGSLFTLECIQNPEAEVMTAPITPALSAEVFSAYRTYKANGMPMSEMVAGLTASEVIAVMNDLLPDNSTRKLTWAHVDRLREESEFQNSNCHTAELNEPFFAQLADIIASYLPPR